MIKELDSKLHQKYSKLFPVGYGETLTPKSSCMFWGLDVGDGWYNLLDTCFEELSKYPVTLEQVKEKFGKLRLYYNWMGSEEIPQDEFDVMEKEVYLIVDKYETISGTVCEVCGNKGELRVELGWITTLCNEHIVKE